MKTATIVLKFAVEDEEVLADLASTAIAEHGLGHEFEPNNQADQIVELLLHSNPAIPPYVDLGIELLSTELENGEEK